MRAAGYDKILIQLQLIKLVGLAATQGWRKLISPNLFVNIKIVWIVNNNKSNYPRDFKY